MKNLWKHLWPECGPELVLLGSGIWMILMGAAIMLGMSYRQDELRREAVAPVVSESISRQNH